jgi:hypothetical protein
MSQETSDLILGAVVLVIFLIFVFVAGWILNKFKNARFTRAWTPLQPIINGKVHEDGGGAATSYLVGTYRGWQVQASMTPNRNRYSGESGHRYNYFDVALLEVPGKHDWSFAYHTPLLGRETATWRVVTHDPALAERLQNANLISVLAGLGHPKIEYKQRGKMLQYQADITPLQVPTPEMFQRQIEALIWMAKINEEVNAK